MDKRITIKPFIIIGSTTSKEAFSRVFVFQPGNEAQNSTHGELYVIISSAAVGVSVDWEKWGVEAFNFLKQQYYKHDGGGPLQALEDAVQQTRETYASKISHPEEGASVSLDMHIGALVIWGGSYVYYSFGNLFFALFRNSELIDLSSDRVVQEAISEGDTFILGTAVFGQRIETVTLQSILKTDLSGNWQQALQEQVENIEEEALLSGIVLQTKGEHVADEEDIITIKMSRDEPMSEPKQLTKRGFVSRLVPRLSYAGIAQPIQSVIKRVSRILSSIRSSDVYLKTPSRSWISKKWMIVAILILFLGISIFVTYHFNKQKAVISEQTEVQKGILAGLDRVRELQEVDPQQARRALDLVEDQIGLVQGVSDEVSNALDEAYSFLYKTQMLEGTSVQGVASQEIIVAAGKDLIYLLERDTGKVSSLSPRVFTTDMLVQYDELAGSETMTYAGGGLYVYHPDTGLWFVEPSIPSVEKIIEQSGQWGTVLRIAPYQDNVYILASGVNQLVKYVGVGNGRLTSGSSYFIEPLSWNQVIDVAIDGHVYTLLSSGTVDKFLGGRRTSFALTGIYPDLANARGVYTAIDFEHVYILLDDGTIGIFTTSGEYIKQLRAKEPITDFIVSADEVTIFVILESGMYTAPL